MKLRWRHPWDVSPRQARVIQERGRARVLLQTRFRTGLDPKRFAHEGRLVAIDVAYDRTNDFCHAALILWDRRSREVLESHTHSAPSTFPYIPGLLSFREIPPLLSLFGDLKPGAFDLILCDGQGIAHPRRFGLATHLGTLYDVPTLGWAKSRLVGTYREPSTRRGSATRLVAGNEQIGWALRSREGCNTTFVSPGHRISIDDSLKIARAMMGQYRLCEPARQAHAATRRAMLESRSRS